MSDLGGSLNQMGWPVEDSHVALVVVDVQITSYLYTGPKAELGGLIVSDPPQNTSFTSMRRDQRKSRVAIVGAVPTFLPVSRKSAHVVQRLLDLPRNVGGEVPGVSLREQ